MGKLRVRLWIVGPRLRFGLGQRLQTRTTVCRGLTFEGALGKDTKLRCVTYQLHRHTERRIEFQTGGHKAENNCTKHSVGCL